MQQTLTLMPARSSGWSVATCSQLQDISERKELERRLEHLVDHDFLTGRERLPT
jgi:hypothetical protein